MLKRNFQLKRKTWPKRTKRDTETTSKDIPCWSGAEIIIMPTKNGKCVHIGDVIITIPDGSTTM